jgi:hypothetical protein
MAMGAGMVRSSSPVVLSIRSMFPRSALQVVQFEDPFGMPDSCGQAGQRVHTAGGACSPSVSALLISVLASDS